MPMKEVAVLDEAQALYDAIQKGDIDPVKLNGAGKKLLGSHLQKLRMNSVQTQQPAQAQAQPQQTAQQPQPGIFKRILQEGVQIGGGLRSGVQNEQERGDRGESLWSLEGLKKSKEAFERGYAAPEQAPTGEDLLKGWGWDESPGPKLPVVGTPRNIAGAMLEANTDPVNAIASILAGMGVASLLPKAKTVVQGTLAGATQGAVEGGVSTGMDAYAKDQAILPAIATGIVGGTVLGGTTGAAERGINKAIGRTKPRQEIQPEIKPVAEPMPQPKPERQAYDLDRLQQLRNHAAQTGNTEAVQMLNKEIYNQSFANRHAEVSTSELVKIRNKALQDGQRGYAAEITRELARRGGAKYGVPEENLPQKSDIPFDEAKLQDMKARFDALAEEPVPQTIEGQPIEQTQSPVASSSPAPVRVYNANDPAGVRKPTFPIMTKAEVASQNANVKSGVAVDDVVATITDSNSKIGKILTQKLENQKQLPPADLGPVMYAEPGGRTHIGEPKLELPPGPYERMLNDITPDVQAEISKVYVPGAKPSIQQFERFVRDVAQSKGYDYDALAKQAGIKPAEPQKMTVVEGKVVTPEEKQLNLLDKEIQGANNYLGGVRKEVTQAAKAAQKEGDIFGYVKSRGGIKPSPSVSGEYNESIPLALKNKNGMALDELAAEMGMDSRQLLDALNSPKSNAFDPDLAVMRDPQAQAIQKTVDTLQSDKAQLAEQMNRPRVKKAEPEQYTVGQKLNTRPYGEVEVAEVGDMLVKLKTKSGETRSVSKRALRSLLAKEQPVVNTSSTEYNIPKEKEVIKEDGGIYGVKKGEAKSNNNVPSAERPGMDNTAQLGQPAQAGAEGVTVKKGIGQKVAEIRSLAKSGKLTMDEAYKFNASNADITDPTKRLIINDVSEAMKKGLHLPDSQVSFEQWHYRKYGQEPPSDRAFLYDQNYLKKEQRKYDAFIKKAGTVETLDQMESDVKASIKSKMNRITSGIDPTLMSDLTKYGAIKIAKGSIKFGQWASEMTKEFGAKIAPHLRSIYAQAKELHSRYVNGDADAVKIMGGPKAKPKQPATSTVEIPGSTQAPNNSIGDASSFRAKINREAKAKRTPFRERWDQLRTQFVDAFVPFENAEKAVRGKISSAEDSLYKTARTFKGTPEKAHEIIRTELNPIIEGIEKKGYSYEDLGDYALAVHTKDVNARGRQMVADAEKKLQEGIQFNEMVKDMIKNEEAAKGQYELADIGKLKGDLEAAKRFTSGFNNAEINDVISKYGNAEMEASRKKLVKLSNRLLDDLVEAGRISAEDVAAIKKKWPNYMPLFRSFDDAKIEFGKGLSDSFANVANPIKKLEGSSRDVIDPIENMIKNIFKITNVAERTKVGKQLLKLADEDVTGEVARRLEPGEEVGRKNVLNLYENGQKAQVEVQPDVYKAMMDMDKESSLLLIELLSKPASVLRAGATLTPEFSVRNPMRDVVNAFVVSESGFNPVIDFPVGLANAIFKGRKIKIMGKELNTPGDMYHQFLMDNGGYGNIVSMDRKVHREALESALKKPVGKKFVNIINPKSWLEVLRAISDVTETATKVGEYRAAIRSGVTRQEAAYRARDLMDFARAGTSIKQANRIIAFLNANIQGKSKLIRAIKENPTGVITRAMVAVVLPTVGAYVAQKTLANDIQRENIKDAPDWLRDTFWLVPIPGTNQVARIPKPFDLAPIFSNSVERFLDYAVDKDPEAFDGFVKRMLDSYSVPVMLTGLIPFFEGMSNYSWFREAPIIPQREQGLRYEDQQDINTTETAKLIASGMNKLTGGEGSFKNFSSPRVVDNAIIGMTAGLGRYATSAIDTILEGVGAVDKPEKPTKSVSQLPVLRAFLVNENASGESVDKLYKERERLTDAKNSAKLNRKPFRETGRLKMVESATTRIGAISKRIRQAENSPSMSSEEKGRLIKKLSADRNRLARDYMDKLQK